MKYTFLTGLLVGFGGLLLAAGAYPWVQHPRLPSVAEVVPNGGRAEQFVIRLPADRIGGFGADAAGGALAARPAPGGRLSIEQFKVRNSQGRVIGVAARHAAVTDDTRGVAWIVSIPSRGALMLADPSAAVGLEAALADLGYVPGSAWEGNLRLETIPSTGEAPQLSAGTAEFAGLEIGFSEFWTVTGVAADGVLRGTIELATISRRGS